MTTRLPLELRYLCLSTSTKSTRPRRTDVFSLARRLQSTASTSTTSSTTSTTSPYPASGRSTPPPPRRRGGRNLALYPTAIQSNIPTLTAAQASTKTGDTYVSLSSPPAYTSFQDTPRPGTGNVQLSRQQLAAEMPSVPTQAPSQGATVPSKRYLRGIELPERPVPPTSDECCMGGCAVCVYDLYADSLESYHSSLLTTRTRLAAAKVPKDLWPENVRLAGEDGKPPVKKAKEGLDDEVERVDASLRAFLDMEKGLKKKRVGASEGRAG